MSLLPENVILLGRRPDLEYLERRIRTQGVTFVVGPPKRGKSSLIRRFCDTLEKDGHWLFGYAESLSAETDLLGGCR